MPLPPENLPPHYLQGNAINNRVTHSDRPWLVLVNQGNPNFARDRVMSSGHALRLPLRGHRPQP